MTETDPVSETLFIKNIPQTMDNVHYHIHVMDQPPLSTFRESLHFVIIRRNYNIPWLHFLGFQAFKLRHLDLPSDYVIMRSYCFNIALRIYEILPAALWP